MSTFDLNLYIVSDENMQHKVTIILYGGEGYEILDVLTINEYHPFYSWVETMYPITEIYQDLEDNWIGVEADNINDINLNDYASPSWWRLCNATN